MLISRALLAIATLVAGLACQPARAYYTEAESDGLQALDRDHGLATAQLGAAFSSFVRLSYAGT